MKYASKIKLTGDDFVMVGLNYNYFMIPRLAYPKENLETLKQQILDNQEMIAELKTVWNKGEQDMVTDEILQTMEKYFGKRAGSDKSGATRDAEFKISLSSEDINKIDEKIRNEDDSIETQNNNNIASGVILFNTCANCDIKFIPKNRNG
jgi:hypothetical protein